MSQYSELNITKENRVCGFLNAGGRPCYKNSTFNNVGRDLKEIDKLVWRVWVLVFKTLSSCSRMKLFWFGRYTFLMQFEQCKSIIFSIKFFDDLCYDFWQLLSIPCTASEFSLFLIRCILAPRLYFLLFYASSYIIYYSFHCLYYNLNALT